MTVVDLGAAPGGWSQIAKALVGEKGKVIGIDLLPMDPIEGVDLFRDFRDDEPYQKLLELTQNRPVDLVCQILPQTYLVIKALISQELFTCLSLP